MVEGTDYRTECGITLLLTALIILPDGFQKIPEEQRKLT